ncbi:helix-turn-helix domain-containing protein [Trueperella bialowiezensis]|uniref:Helix-turn-helix n=1 Tax=Trueperella bialowiezensis TaxID=312285 RepID=A0A448PE85_9ACTO|nr:helix-turn-helix domain-containing protein [Trueperella bialowiezensis]VEI13251.1 Helix-turn-helix [Trueperella bialowiezensis]
MSSTFPEPWKTLADRVGITSYGQLAERSGLSRPTVYSAVSGRSARPQLKTLAGLAEAFRISTEELLDILGRPAREEVEEYRPPEEAALLTRREREAVDEIIRLLIKARQQNTTNDVDAYLTEADAKRTLFEAHEWDMAARHKNENSGQ